LKRWVRQLLLSLTAATIAACAGANAPTNRRDDERRPTSIGAPKFVASSNDAGAPGVGANELVFPSACIPKKIRIPAHVELDCGDASSGLGTVYLAPPKTADGGTHALVRFLRPLCIQKPDGTTCVTEPPMTCSSGDPSASGDVLATITLSDDGSHEVHAQFGGADPSLSLANGSSLSPEQSVVEDCCETIPWTSDDLSEPILRDGRVADDDSGGRWLFHPVRAICLPGHVRGDARAGSVFPLAGPAADAIPQAGIGSMHGLGSLRAERSAVDTRYVVDFTVVMGGPTVTPVFGSRRLPAQPTYYPVVETKTSNPARHMR
jgi:hypothetical protein